MASRRDLLHAGSGLAAAAFAGSSSWAAGGLPRTLLILGGTGFIGPTLTAEALRRGWKVTHFNRGKHAQASFPQVETLLGDRNGNLDSLRTRTWDAVIDDTGWVPKFVKLSAELLAPQTRYMLFVSSISVYASFATPNDESSPLAALP